MTEKDFAFKLANSYLFVKCLSMKLAVLSLLAIVVLSMSPDKKSLTDDPVTLAIGSKAPDFKLPGVDGKTYSLASFSKAKIVVVVFTCNHCPTAQAYEDRIIQMAKEYGSKGVSVVAISPNDPDAVRLDELGFSDMGDSFEEMKLRSKEKKYNFPYLYDGKTQITSKAYGAIATPHVFIFDKERKLRFQGRVDDVENPTRTPNNTDTRNAIEALLADKPVPVETTKVFGCSVKWASKKEEGKKFLTKWAQEPVDVQMIDEAGIRDLLKNSSDKLRLINVWATWCGPCVTEFPDFVTINRMYRGRDFEFITVSADNAAQKEKVLKFLKGKEASNKNYLFSVDDKYKLIEAIDPKWQGALPYTILVEPGGRIVYGKQGPIDVTEMKRTIVENPLIGRYYK
jgi:thiol-disulfide isomerase/thioredoxin